ncbi:hypothetical protein T4A_4290, partial [Trichinella pseudospiralis]
MLLAGFLERFLVAVAIRTAQPFRFHCPPPVPYYMDSRLPSLEAPVLIEFCSSTPVHSLYSIEELNLKPLTDRFVSNNIKIFYTWSSRIVNVKNVK